MTVTAEAANIVAIRSPTMMSGHPDPVSATTALAISTAALPATSLSEHTHADRMLMSSVRRRHSSARQTPFARMARTPIPPITSAEGTTPVESLTITWASTPTPNAAMIRPFRSAARVCQTTPRDAT
jgi:hypothetical protein